MYASIQKEGIFLGWVCRYLFSTPMEGKNRQHPPPKRKTTCEKSRKSPLFGLSVSFPSVLFFYVSLSHCLNKKKHLAASRKKWKLAMYSILLKSHRWRGWSNRRRRSASPIVFSSKLCPNFDIGRSFLHQNRACSLVFPQHMPKVLVYHKM